MVDRSASTVVEEEGGPLLLLFVEDILVMSQNRTSGDSFDDELLDLLEHAQDRREDVAAMRIQAAQRGRQERQKMRDKRDKAKRKQALQRERDARMEADREAAAKKIQSIQRGRQVRVSIANREAAAAKIQAVQRGRQTRKKPIQSQYDWVGNSAKADRSFYGNYDDVAMAEYAPVATLAHENQPYPMHVVHQQQTTHYLTYPGPDGQMPPPFAPNMMSQYAHGTPFPGGGGKGNNDFSYMNSMQVQTLPPPSGGPIGEIPPLPAQFGGAFVRGYGDYGNNNQMEMPPVGRGMSQYAVAPSIGQIAPSPSANLYNSPPSMGFYGANTLSTNSVDPNYDSLNSSRKGTFKIGFQVVEPAPLAKEFQNPLPARKKRGSNGGQNRSVKLAAPNTIVAKRSGVTENRPRRPEKSGDAKRDPGMTGSKSSRMANNSDGNKRSKLQATAPTRDLKRHGKSPRKIVAVNKPSKETVPSPAIEEQSAPQKIEFRRKTQNRAYDKPWAIKKDPPRRKKSKSPKRFGVMASKKNGVLKKSASKKNVKQPQPNKSISPSILRRRALELEQARKATYRKLSGFSKNKEGKF